ncbi:MULTISPECIES: glycosyltransferase [unclassified Rhodococcus (in: high G+C Gram-positive bacteria)]|uniref:glycosyltransferase n=1 Tax=unclassified Rhodococcus (in: high G+C Gram-positive bacteria) TaxID=192944 RepID=UPI00163A0421|nr:MULTISPECIES: glycosyltransferase [unclassified Rhodococcus (in: high G+C Gram-positive bacteria)]MBC2638239.1 glycosyltransferase [Rhodococcus sp. 3A]MBC2897018.1 glycosyltransferase [Rhodococcus sp. 4CII]
MADPNGVDTLHTISVVIPVYRGENTIAELVAEIERSTTASTTPDGHPYVVSEVVLVHDHGPDRSDRALLELELTKDFLRVMWLSRNYGQDAATIAGMTASSCRWIVTMDEDGQHDPAFIPAFLDAALRSRADLVYSAPSNPPPHSFLRNLTSRAAKKTLASLFAVPTSVQFQSYRLIRGDVGRKLADITASGVYLDVALSWVIGRTATTPVVLRSEGRAESGYTYRSLFSLFWKMVLSTGTRGLRIVGVLGLLLATLGLVLAIVVTVGALRGEEDPEGWASLMVVVLLCSGAILFSLGMIAEYLGVVLHVLIGRPLYLTVDPPHSSPRSMPHSSDSHDPVSRGTEHSEDAP